jgi:hypothetical protein
LESKTPFFPLPLYYDIFLLFLLSLNLSDAE